MVENNSGGIHPLLIIGVIIFIIPVIFNTFHVQLPKFITTIGIIILVLGIFMTVYYSLKAR